MRQILVLFALCGLLLHSSTALYTSSGPVKLVTKRTFASEIVESDLPSVVEFFAPWCGHCKQLAPIYKKVAENLQGLANVAAVDCDEASNKPLCGQYGVQGFPTLKLFSADKQKNPYTKKVEKTPSDYNGPRTAKAIADAVLAQLPDTLITTVRGAAKLDTFKASSELPKVVLASAKSKATPLYKSLSLRFKGRMTFAAVKDADSEVVEALNMSAFPAVVVITPDGELVPYEGKLKAQELIDFLSQHASGAPAADDMSSKKAGAARDPEADDKGSDDTDKVVPQVVQELSLESLEALVSEEDAWLVAFFKGTECNATLADFNKAVSELGPLIKAGYVNLTSEEAAANGAVYGVDAAALSASPCALDIALAPFDDKGDPAEWQRYTGDMGSPKDLQRFALEAFPSLVTRINAASLHAFVSVDALAPAVLLFTDKDETPGVFAALSVNLRKYRYRFADVHSSDAQLMKQFSVKKVPSMVITYVKPGMEVKAGENVPVALQHYPGPLKYPFMHSFLSTFASMMGAKPEGEGDDLSSFLEGQGKAGGGGPVEVPEAVNNADVERLCGAKSGLCAVALLDASDEAFQGHLHTWKEAAGKWAKQPLHFLWVDAARQGSFLAGFGLSKAALPSAVAFSPRKLRGAALSGAYSAQSVHALLDGLFSGRVHTTRFQEVPQLVEGGEDEPAVEEAVEEEFDLADVLGEEVGGSSSKEELLRKAEQELEEEEAKRRAAESEAQANAAGSKKKGGKKKKKKTAAKPANEEL